MKMTAVHDGLWTCWSPSLFSLLNYHLHPNMTKHFAANKYLSDDDIISVVDDFVGLKVESFIIKGTQALQFEWKMIVHHKQG